jgi:hypothetical protein
VLVLQDALVTVIFYFRKRQARHTWHPVLLPVRPAILSMAVISELTTATARISLTISDWLLHAYDTAFSRISCAGRRHVQHKGSSILTPCLRCSDDTPLHECNTDGYTCYLCKLCLANRGNIPSGGGVFEITDNIACHGLISTVLLLLLLRSFGNCLYHVSSDTGVIAATAVFVLHPVHTVTVLTFLVSSSSICTACMQLVHTLSTPVYSTVSKIVDMRKRSIQHGSYHKFIRRAKTVVMADLTALAIIAATSNRVTSTTSTTRVSPVTGLANDTPWSRSSGNGTGRVGAQRTGPVCESNEPLQSQYFVSALCALRCNRRTVIYLVHRGCSQHCSPNVRSRSNTLIDDAIVASDETATSVFVATTPTANWSTSAPPAWPPASNSSVLQYVTPTYPTAYSLASTPIQPVVLTCNPYSQANVNVTGQTMVWAEITSSRGCNGSIPCRRSSARHVRRWGPIHGGVCSSRLRLFTSKILYSAPAPRSPDSLSTVRTNEFSPPMAAMAEQYLLPETRGMFARHKPSSLSLLATHPALVIHH